MSSPGEPVRPLTRREIREREQAAAAAAAAAAERPAAPAPSGGGYGQRPPVTQPPAAQPPAARPAHGPGSTPGQPQARPSEPSRPTFASPPEPTVSRRTLRDPETGGYTPSTPTVRPPASSAGTRRLDETGRLSPVEETGVFGALSRTELPGRAAPSAPTRTPSAAGSTAVFGSPSRATPPSQQQRTESQSQWSAPANPFGGSTAEQPDSSRTTPPRQSVLSRGADAPARPAFGTQAPAEPTAAPAPAPAAPAAALPWGAPPAAAVTPAATPPAPVAEDPAPAAELPWGSITGAEKPASFPARGAAASDDGPFGRSSTRSEPVAQHEDDEDWDDEEPHHAYTWLHYLILVAVAFVLGLLIWELVLRGDEPGFSDTGAMASHLLGRLPGVPPSILS